MCAIIICKEGKKKKIREEETDFFFLLVSVRGQQVWNNLKDVTLQIQWGFYPIPTQPSPRSSIQWRKRINAIDILPSGGSSKRAKCNWLFSYERTKERKRKLDQVVGENPTSYRMSAWSFRQQKAKKKRAKKEGKDAINIRRRQRRYLHTHTHTSLKRSAECVQVQDLC